MKTPPYPQTPQQARAWFTSNGISITDWCQYHQLDRYIVTDLLRGRLKGVRGDAHHAAIALGLKPDPTTLQLAALPHWREQGDLANRVYCLGA